MVNGATSDRRHEQILPKIQEETLVFSLKEGHLFLRVISKRGTFHDLDTSIGGLKKIQKFKSTLTSALLIHGTGRQKEWR